MCKDLVFQEYMYIETHCCPLKVVDGLKVKHQTKWVHGPRQVLCQY